MNMLTNLAVQNLDEAGLLSPVGGLQADDRRPDGRQAEIAEGVRRARRLRAEAYHAAAGRLFGLLKRLLGSGSR